MQQQQQQPTQSFQGTPGESSQSLSIGSGVVTPLASVNEEVHLPSSKDGAASPVVSEHGNFRLHSHGANYVSDVHWAAVLDSISEINDLYETEKEARMLATSDYMPDYSSPSPRLLYEPVQVTKDDILASIPARAVVDRMVARHFNMQGVVPGTFLIPLTERERKTPYR